MKWFNNMKLKTKLLSSFSVIALIVGIIGYLGYSGLDETENALEEVGIVRMPSTQFLLSIDAAQASILLAERGLLIDQIKGDIRKAQFEWIDKQYSALDNAMARYKELEKSESEKELWNQFKILYEKFKEKDENLLAMARKKDEILARGVSENDPIIQNLDDETFQASLEARSAYLTSYEVMQKLIDKNNNIANQYYQDASNSAENAKTQLIIFILFGSFLAVGFGYFISNSVSRAIKKLCM